MRGYADYLRLDDLLSLQRTRSAAAGAELAFIVVHQVHELWFKLIISDLRGTVAALDGDDPWGALQRLRRIHAIEELMTGQLTVLARLEPHEFAEIRSVLGSASAAESRQFALIERLSSGAARDPRGNGGAGGARGNGGTHDPRGNGGAGGAGGKGGEPDVWSRFCAFATRHGTRMPTSIDVPSHHIRHASLLRIYSGSGQEILMLRRIAEALLDHDELFALWRHRHLLLAARQIGRRPGTGGTSGVPFLQARLDRRFYPELWDVRTALQAGIRPGPEAAGNGAAALADRRTG